jgi:hypothetical protein
VPGWVFQAAVYIVAAAIVVVVLSGVATAVSQRARMFVLGRIGGAIYRAVTEEARTSEQRLAAKQLSVSALHKALDDLGDAAFEENSGYAEEAAARVRRYCPQARDSLNTMLAILRREHWSIDPGQLHHLLDNVRDSAAECLEPNA